MKAPRSGGPKECHEILPMRGPWHSSVQAIRLSDDEREQIGLAKAPGHSIGAIAKTIGRPKSTVSRELSRNSSGQRQFRGLHRKKVLAGTQPPSAGPSGFWLGQIGANVAKFFRAADIGVRLQHSFPPHAAKLFRACSSLLFGRSAPAPAADRCHFTVARIIAECEIAVLAFGRPMTIQRNTNRGSMPQFRV